MRWPYFPLAFLFAGVSIILSTAASALITVGGLDTPGSARGVEVVGDLAYVADYDSGLRVIDVSNPSSPISPPRQRLMLCPMVPNHERLGGEIEKGRAPLFRGGPILTTNNRRAS